MICCVDYPNPRRASELAGEALRAKGVKVVVVRLPQVRDTVKQGLITPLVEVARATGVSANLGEGDNHWPAAHVLDVARLYRLTLEQGRDGERFHAVDEEGVTAREIAEALGAGLGLPTASLLPEAAAAHFGFTGAFVGLDMTSSSAWTRERLGWRPSGPDLLADLRAMDYANAG